METEVTVATRIAVAWRIENGIPVVDSVRVINCDIDDARRALAEQLRPLDAAVH